MSTLNRLHVKITLPLFFLNRGIPRVREWTRMSVAQACQIEFISAESLSGCLGLERTMPVVYDFPHNVVLDHNNTTIIL